MKVNNKMASQMILALALVAMAVNVASAYGPFGMGFDGGYLVGLDAAFRGAGIGSAEGRRTRP